jgi:hypothetical protein
MNYDTDRIDEMTLALMYLVMSRGREGGLAWKGFDWLTMDRLEQKGWISDPKVKGATVRVTSGGMKRAEELFRKHFQTRAL